MTPQAGAPDSEVQGQAARQLRAAPAPAGPPEQRAMIFGFLPALITLVVGAVWIGGAVTEIGQLMAADYEPRDVFPALPLEQHLARGMQIFLGPFLFLMAAIWLLQGAAVPPHPKTTEEVEVQESQRKAQKWVSLPILGAAWILGLVSLPWTSFIAVVVGLLVTALVYIAVFWKPSLMTWTRRRMFLVVFPTSLIAVAIAGAFISPNPLPLARVETSAGEIRGPLLLKADDEWWIGQGEGRVVVVRGDETDAASIRSRERPEDETLPELIL